MRSKESLHPYQEKAIDWLYEHDRSLALCPVGAGKTVIAWTTIAELMDAGEIERPLVFAPLRVAQFVWGQERGEWQHLDGRPVVQWSGEPASWEPSPWRESRLLWGSIHYHEGRLPKLINPIQQRAAKAKLDGLIAEEKRVNKIIRKTPMPKAVYITSYENLLWLTDLYDPGESPFDLWVFDEVGKLKNPKSPRYKAVCKHTKEAKMVIGLNATPAPEGMEDLFAQVRVVDGGALWGKSFYQWRQKYFTPTDYQGYNWRLQLGAEKLLLDDLNTLAFRVDEKQLSYHSSMAHTQIGIELPPPARAAYAEMVRHMAVELAERDDIVAMSAAAASMKLRQIANGFIYDEAGKAVVLHEEKAHALSDLLDEMGREPLLIAYEFSEDLAAIRRVWKNAPFLGQGVSSAVAGDLIARWNKRELPVLALHPFSAGHGVNLQAGGSHICWYSIPWPLESWLQTNGRIDRQGQTRACFGHSIIARDTIDERVSDALIEKNEAQTAVIAAIRSIIK